MRFWPKRETPTARVSRMLNIRGRLMNADIIESGIQREIDRLIELKEGNADIRDLSNHPGWQEIEADLGERALRKLRALPKLITDGEWETALADAHFIRVADVVLGLVNETLLESARVELLLNTKIAVQERLQQEMERE